MMIDDTTTRPRTWTFYAVWALKIFFGLSFFAGGVMKLGGGPAVIEEFDALGLGQWFRYFTAACEIGGAAMMLWPRTAFFGALLLMFVSIGAFLAQLLVLHHDVVHTIVFVVAMATVAWVSRETLMGKA